MESMTPLDPALSGECRFTAQKAAASSLRVVQPSTTAANRSFMAKSRAKASIPHALLVPRWSKVRAISRKSRKCGWNSGRAQLCPARGQFIQAVREFPSQYRACTRWRLERASRDDRRTNKQRKRHEADERDVPFMVDDGNGGGRGTPVRPGRQLPQCPARRAPAWQRRAAHPGRLRLPDLRGPRQMRRPVASALPGRSRHHTTRHGLPTRQRRVLLGPVIRVITTSTVRQKWIVEAAVPGKALSSDQAERIRTWG